METTRWDKNCVSEVRNVVVVGATHGNELHGIHLVDEINSDSALSKFKEECPSLSIRGIIGNVAAAVAVGTGAGLRYCETDLNRCFLLEDLANRDISSIEGLRAKEIDALLGPKSSDSPITDLILDFHSTTSNTGILLLCHPRDKFSLRLIAYLQSVHPTISVCMWPDTEVSLLPSIARSGMTVEVGPIPHSTSNTELYQRTKVIMHEAILYTEMHNRWVRAGMPTTQLKPVKLQLFRRFATLGYPRDSTGSITGLIHSSLQGAPELMGGTTVKSGSPIFQVMADASTIYYSDDENAVTKYRIEYNAEKQHASEPLYPMFINEAAYNEKDIAFLLMLKLELDVSVVCQV